MHFLEETHKQSHNSKYGPTSRAHTTQICDLERRERGVDRWTPPPGACSMQANQHHGVFSHQ